MELIKNYSDFISFISDGKFNGYEVCFEDASFHADTWLGKQFLDFLTNIEQYKSETGIICSYQSSCDEVGRIMSVFIEIFYPPYKGIDGRTEWMKWAVQY